MKRVFNLQKGINEVTITLDCKDYYYLMATLKNVRDLEEMRKGYWTNDLNQVIEIIESIEPEYIWDEI